MTAPKHTPGPWWWDEEEARIRASSGRETGGRGIAVARSIRGEMGPTEYTANATLITAAPELLEALESICERLEHHLGTLTTEGDRAWVSGEVRCARAAIAKARGES